MKALLLLVFLTSRVTMIPIHPLAHHVYITTGCPRVRVDREKSNEIHCFDHISKENLVIPKHKPACGHMDCDVSSGIDGSITFGSGLLDDYGYWEHPCSFCARAFEENHPDMVEMYGPCWPFKEKKNGKERNP